MAKQKNTPVEEVVKPKPVMSIADLVNTLEGVIKSVDALNGKVTQLIQQQNRIALSLEKAAAPIEVNIDPAQVHLPFKLAEVKAYVVPTTEEVRSVVLAFIAKHGREKMQTILKKYGAAKATEVEPAKLQAFLGELRG